MPRQAPPPSSAASLTRTLARPFSIFLPFLVALLALGACDNPTQPTADLPDDVLQHHRPGHAGGPTRPADDAEPRIALTGGDDQSGVPGETLPTALSVRVTDSDGNPFRQVEVTWNVDDGGGTLSDASTRTDGQGRSEVQWTLGSDPGTYAVEARVGDATGTFSGTVLEPGSDDGTGDDTGSDEGTGDGSQDDAEDEGTLTISPGVVTLTAVGDETQLDVEAQDANGATISAEITWSSTDRAIAEVDQEGTVLAKAAGIAYVVAAAACCDADTAMVEVTPVVDAVVVSPSDAQISIGGTIRLDATALDANGHEVDDVTFDWSSSNPSVAEVDSRGRVTGLSGGTAEIRASAGVTGSATVDVASADTGPGSPAGGIWISRSQLESLPTSGSAWSNMKSAADSDLRGGVLTDRDNHNVRVMAAGLVAARLDDDRYRARVRDALQDLMSVRLDNDDGLAVNRRLVAYVVAADLIDLPSFDSSTDRAFREWLELVRTTSFQSGGGGTIAEYHERRPNNYGTMAGASRMAVALYLGDSAELERAARVFRGWLGDRSAYSGFKFGSDLSWQADENAPVGINPRGATWNGRSIDGVLPDDQRRCGSIDDEPWPCTTNYSYGGMAGALAQAQILSQQGYAAFEWSDRALLRAMTWLHEVADQQADGDREWQPHLVNGIYGTRFPAPSGARPGKNVGWADWTH